MKKMEITAKLPARDRSATIVVDAPETAAEAIQMYGDTTVLQNALRNWCVTLQASIRRCLEKGMTEEEIKEKMKGAKMGAAVQIGRVVDPIQAALAKAATMTPEELSEFIAQLKARIK